MPSEQQIAFNHLVSALRHLKDAELLSAWKTAVYVHELAKPGHRHMKAIDRRKACEMIVEERFGVDTFSDET